MSHIGIKKVKQSSRHTYSLNGLWECAATPDTQTGIPAAFTHQIPVPGFWDDVKELGDYKGKALWYRKEIKVDGNVPERVILRIGKAEFGQTIYVNRKRVRYFPYNFVASETDITRYLKADGDNEIIVRVSNKEDQTRHPEGTGHQGFDGERLKYLPGIYDDVSLIVTRHVAIERFQNVPCLDKGTVTVRAYVTNSSPVTAKTFVDFEIARLGVIKDGSVPRNPAVVGRKKVSGVTVKPNESKMVEVEIPLEGFDKERDAWAPDSPVLYELKARTLGDEKAERFGMRTFSVDAATKRMMLNGKPHYMLGTNLLFFRFSNDPLRASLPWDDGWVRTFFSECKRIGFDSYRMCSGFGPEKWYEICDELGIMIQDEYPYWQVCAYDDSGIFCKCTPESLMPEYRLWMRERGMHPGVVVWDLQNESYDEMFIDMARELRGEDPQNRPFEMGWTHNEVETDIKETHPYMFCAYDFTLSYLNGHDRVPNTFGNTSFDLPMIINEYGYNWLNRNGDPTILGEDSYNWNVPGGSRQDRLAYYARSVSMLSEFWRISGTSAGLHHFCALTYSYDDNLTAYTGDILMPDIRTPRFHPCIVEAFGNAFNPLMIGIDDYIEEIRPNAGRSVEVHMINDRAEDMGEITASVKLTDEQSNVIWEKRIDFSLPANSRGKRTVLLPACRDWKGKTVTLAASFTDPVSGREFRSVRPMKVLEKEAGHALNCPATASSVEGGAFWDTPCTALRVTDGTWQTRWHSRAIQDEDKPKSHQQVLSEKWCKGLEMPEGADVAPWIDIDLVFPTIVSKVELGWAKISEKVYAPEEFAIQISDDGENYKTVWQGKAIMTGEAQTVTFSPIRAGHVRMQVTGDMPNNSVSIWEFDVF